ncbi:class I SAM-dependent RNA methyltransferase [Nannocystaceae bacterium ST9]
MPPTPELAVGAQLELRGQALDADGSGVVELGGRHVHVPGLLPGELAQIRVDNLARFSANAYGHMLALLEPHAHRRSPPCPQHRDPLDRSGRAGTCGGCPLMHLEVAAQREAKRERLRELGLEVAEHDMIGEGEWGYRWSSKRVVAGKLGSLWLGSRRADPLAHAGQIADMQGCRVDHPAIERVFERLLRLANAERIQGWRPGHQDKPATGDLRYVWAKTDGERVLLTLITSPGESSQGESRAAQELPHALMAELPELVGVAWSVQPERGNAIRGRAPELLAGVGSLTLELAGVRVEVGPLGFLQPNPPMAARAYLDLVDVPANLERVWDLYAGIGVTTALLRARHREVIACESYAESAQALGIDPMAVEDFLLARKSERPQLIVANPPRAGLGAEVCSRLLEVGAPRLHMMSCNAETLADDLARLAPGYELERLRGYDTLPQTAHLELVAWLRRR